MVKAPNPIKAARIAANQTAKLQRQQTAANRILARSDAAKAKYSKNHPLYNYTTPTSITDPTAQSATDNSLNQPNQVVQGGGGGGSTIGTNDTGGVPLYDGSGSGTASPTAPVAGSFFSQHKGIIIGVAGLVGVFLYIKFRK